MDIEEKITRKSFFDSATFLSKLLFGWSLKFFATGFWRELNLNDYSKCSAKDEAKYLFEKLNQQWKRELKYAKEKNKKPSILKSILRTYEVELLFLTLMHIIDETIALCHPLLIGIIVRYFSPAKSEITTSYEEARNAGIRVALRVKSALSALVFQKILKLSKSATGQTNIGLVLNLISNDLNKIDDVAWTLFFIIVAPFELVAVHVILWQYMGISCLAALAIIIVYSFTQWFLAKLLNKFRSEVKQMKNSYAVRMVNFVTAELATKILVFFTLLVHLLLGNQLNAEITFVTLALFNVIRYPVTFHAPNGIGYLAETLVTLRRIQELLLLEERQDDLKEINFAALPKGSIHFFKYCGKWTRKLDRINLKNITMQVEPGELVIIAGPVGSGKTCLLMAILNEIEKISGKTRILVTHQLQYINKADKIMILKDGECLAYGTPQQLQKAGIDFLALIGSEKEESEKVELTMIAIDEIYEKNEAHNVETIPLSARMSLVAHIESKEEYSTKGSIKFKVYLDYFKAGTNHFMFIVTIGFVLFSQFLYNYMDYWLASWMDYTQSASLDRKEINLTLSSQEANNRDFFVYDDQMKNITFYAIAMLVLLLTYALRIATNVLICLKASINLHNRIFSRLLRASIAFFDNNPTGRILNRFTGDMGFLDQKIPMSLLDINLTVGVVIGSTIVSCLVDPYLIIVATFLLAISLPLRRIYLRTVSNVKRNEAITRSPIFTEISTTFDGLTCIRAFKYEHKFEEQFHRFLNDNNACKFLWYALSRSFGFILDWFTIIFFTSITTMLLIFPENIKGGTAGLILSSAIILINEFQFCIRIISEFETQMVSVERVLEYGEIPSEAPLKIVEKKPPANWPKNGCIVFNHVYLTYPHTMNRVLHDLCFTIDA
ncbi:multidrug resistance-associated protein 4-like protein, partial [Dinothrombium tinctorium]